MLGLNSDGDGIFIQRSRHLHTYANAIAIGF